jgi:hypothetical protein
MTEALTEACRHRFTRIPSLIERAESLLGAPETAPLLWGELACHRGHGSRRQAVERAIDGEQPQASLSRHQVNR